MTARNANWDRWAYASIAKHITANTSNPVVYDFGGKRTEAWEQAEHRAEVTIGHLRTTKTGRTTKRVAIDVFVIVSSDITANNYTHVDAVGDVANALDSCILVKDYGATGLEDIGLLQAPEEVDPTALKPAQTDDRLHSTISVTLTGRFQQ